MGLQESKISSIEIGKHRDSTGPIKGLYLHVDGPQSKRWVYRYTTPAGTKRRELGLGSWPDVSVKQARDLAIDFSRKIRQGIDPVDEKRKAKASEKDITFGELAEQVWQGRKDTFKNPKHAAAWISTLRQYVFPTFGNLPVSKVEAWHITQALEPVWLDREETARRVLQRVGQVLGYARAKSLYHAHDPVPDVRAGLTRQTFATKNFEALPYEEMPKLLAALRGKQTASAHALEFTILTASRSGPVREAAWSEIDLDGGWWRVPGAKMKTGKDHLVPLSPQAIKLLKWRRQFPGNYVFTSDRSDKPMSDATMRKLLQEALGQKITVHGFRSSFKDWAREQCADVPDEVSELCLAHTVGDATRRAYARSALDDARRSLLNRWADFCDGGAA